MTVQAFAIHEGQSASKKPTLGTTDMIFFFIYQHFGIK